MHAVETFEIILALLTAAMALHWFASRARLPPSAMLLIGGGVLAFVPGLPSITLDPQLIPVLFLPPLLMDGAYYTAFGRFRRHLPGILSLAVGAVIFTTLVVAVVTYWLLPQLPWAACFALGAIVSPPDAIAARAFLSRVNLPRRLQALLEGESLLNDATGLVLFRFAVAATLTSSFHPGAAVGSFAILALGGAMVGGAVAFASMAVLKRLGDQTLVVAGTTLLCWGAYIAGEGFHVSGIIATVAAGIVFGWYQHVIFPAAVRLQGGAFWRTLVFTLDALVFILMGLSLRQAVERAGGVEEVLATFAAPALGVVVAVVSARFVWVLASDTLQLALRGIGAPFRPLGWRQGSVLSWAGMRGVVTLAIALTLPENMPGRDFMLIAAFAVILVTVIVQGTSLGALIRAVKPIDVDPRAPLGLAAAEAAIAHAKLAAAKRVSYSADGTLVHPQLVDMYRARALATDRFASDAHGFMQDIRPHFDAMLVAIAAGRAELIRLHREGQIEDEVLHDHPSRTRYASATYVRDSARLVRQSGRGRSIALRGRTFRAPPVYASHPLTRLRNRA